MGIVRERLFGNDTVEEALKVVDNISSKYPTSIRTLVGINDQEFNLINKSLTSRRSLKGRSMSPVLAMCHSNSIPYHCIGRKISATSSRLSCVFMKHPLELYRLLWIIANKSLSVVRTPQARQYIEGRVPKFVKAYFVEGSDTMAYKILMKVHDSDDAKIVAIVPMENFHDIVQILESKPLEQETISDVERKLNYLEEDMLGLWGLVLVVYIIAPVMMSAVMLRKAYNWRFAELGYFETEGVSIVGSWVRDRRRD